MAKVKSFKLWRDELKQVMAVLADFYRLVEIERGRLSNKDDSVRITFTDEWVLIEVEDTETE